MAHPRARLSVFSRQLLVMRVQAGWPVGARRRAAGDQPGDRVQVGPPVPGRGSGRARSTGARGRTARRAGRAEALRPRSSPPASSWRYGPDRLGPLARPAALDRPPGARAARLQPPARRRPGRPRRPSATSPAIRARCSTRTTRSWAASPTAAAGACGAGSGPRTATARWATTTSRSSSTTPAATRSSSRSPTRPRPARPTRSRSRPSSSRGSASGSSGS